MCCDAGADEGQPLTWTYVGQGRGDYDPTQKLEYVGVGRGSYVQNAVEPKSLWWRPWVCLFFILALLLLVLALIWHLLQRPVPQARGIQPVVVPLAPTYHCQLPVLGAEAASAAIVEESWMAIDLDGDGLVPKSSFTLWQSQGLFSPNAVNLMNGTDADSDGMVDNEEYVEALKASAPNALDHQQWISAAWVLADKNLDGAVHRSEMGLLQKPGNLKKLIDEQLFRGDANADSAIDRKEFEHGLAMVAAAQGGFHELFEEIKGKYWLQEKRAWCCERQGVACGSPPPETTPAPAYDCHSEYASRLSWPEMKRAWCCGHHRIACSEKVSAPYDCDAGLSNWRAGWSEKKKAWCCFHTDKGCDKVSEPYDCRAGLSNWKAGWSHGKKKWCCHNKGTGCLPEYDCQAGLNNWRAGWSSSKKQWCCDKFNLGCQETATYDCNAGLSNWMAGWSESKKQWCCTHEQKGCHVSEPYDCLAGLANWRAGWSHHKKQWCCAYHKEGCEAVA
eukprot:TRINITY_DN108553_c0_g1_i1.p1 TRINITY_DN108553_c0_g1~~TRINITY_DN108553_c0_g1_i1.p1  ORF type:complete len:530 (-),score=94.36 TRINITY_DN108553_c0_g1_i1:80-1588(-)